MSKKLKILVSCYACSPYRGSEPGMGWNFVKELSKHHEVHVITEKEKWQYDIERYQKENEVSHNLYFYYIKKNRNRKLRKIWPPSYYWFYRVWQKKAYHLAQKMIKAEDFDLVHQLNMVGYREPGYLWKLSAPFVWGPIGGTQNVPWHLFSVLDLHGKLFYGSRNILNSIQKHFLKRPYLATKRSHSELISATPDIQKDALKLWKKRSHIITEVGSSSQLNTSTNSRLNNQVLKIVWSGQHTSGKALNILLQSVALLEPSVKWELHILGVGKQTKQLKHLANKLGIAPFCNWYGWVAKERAENIMAQGHVFCITSLKDLTSTVTIEAISVGLPVVCMDHCGFAYVINESCGIKIPVEKLKDIRLGFKSAISLLYNNETKRKELAEGALKRAKDFSWNKKIEKLNAIYSNLVG